MMMKPTIPEVRGDIKAYFMLPGHCNGGSLHIVLVDENVNDSHVKWCRKEAALYGDEAGVELAEKLLRMSQTQRRKLARQYWFPSDDLWERDAALLSHYR